MKPRRKLLISIGALGVIHIAVRLLPSFGSVLVFDHVLSGQPLSLSGYPISPGMALWLTAAALIVMMAVEMSLIYWQRLLYAESGESTIRDLREASYEKLLRLPVPFFQVRNGGKMILRFIGDMSAVAWLAEGGLVSTVLDLVTLVVVTVLFFWIEPLLALAALLLFPFFVWVLWHTLQPLQAERRNVRRARIELAGRLQEQFLNAGAMRLLFTPDRLRSRFRRLNQQVYSGNVNLARRGGWLESISVSVSSFMSGVILLFGAWLALHDVLTVGELFAFYYLALLIFPIFRRLALFDQEYAQAMVGMERVVFLLNQKEIAVSPHAESGEQRPPLRVTEGRITVRDLDFAHTPKRGFVFQNLNLECPPGCITTIVGPMGAGKSSLALLLAGQLTPSIGNVCIDGQDILTCDLLSPGNAVALVEQHVELFADTLLANICMGWDWKGAGLSKSERNDRVEAMARLIGADHFIDALPRGYRTQAGQRGIRLSARERAMVGLLRALVRQPAILLIDGAESFRAPELLMTLRTLLRPSDENFPPPWLKNVVLFTHDPLIAFASDHVIFFDNDGAVESDAPDNLLNNPDNAFVSYFRQHRSMVHLSSERDLKNIALETTQSSSNGQEVTHVRA
ncbi:MAG: ABC transporter transmembrane domain-containing protein [Caldilinea sp.]